MGNSQNNASYLNILVFDPDKTEYIENIFKPLVYNSCSINSIKSKILKLSNSSVGFVPESIPFLNDLQWKFYFMTNENKNELIDLLDIVLENSLNIVAVIIGNNKETTKSLTSFIEERKNNIFIYTISKEEAENPDLFQIITVQLKFELLKIYSYYNELGDIFSFPKDDFHNFQIDNHIKSQNSINYFYYHDIKGIIPKEENCLGIMVIGPKKIGKSKFINISLHEKRAKVGLGGTSKINGYIHSKYPICFYDTPGVDINNKEGFISLYEEIKKHSNIQCVLYFLSTQPTVIERIFFERIRKLNNVKLFFVSTEGFFSWKKYNMLFIEERIPDYFYINLLNCGGIRELYNEVRQRFTNYFINFSDVFISEENEYLKLYFKNGEKFFFTQVVIKSFDLFHSYLCFAINNLEELDIHQQDLSKTLTNNCNLLSYITKMVFSIDHIAGEKDKSMEKIKNLYQEVTESLLNHNKIKEYEKAINQLCTKNNISYEYYFSKIINDIINNDFLNIPSIRIIYNVGLITLLKYYKGLLTAINCFDFSIINMHLAVKGLSEIANEYY